MGHECTLVHTNEHERKAAFCPGDPTVLFCISASEARLINLRAHSECSAFCSAVDKHYGRSAAVSGTKTYTQDASPFSVGSVVLCNVLSSLLASVVAAAAATATAAAAAALH